MLAVSHQGSIKELQAGMASAAVAGRSQRELWWRLVDVLTCKSLFGLGYRGKRLGYGGVACNALCKHKA